MARSKPTKEASKPAQEDNLAHTKCECKYHIVFIPKFRRKSLFGLLRNDLGNVFRELALHKDSWIEEGPIFPDHVHMLVPIPPKHKVSEVLGFIKRISAIWIARHCEGRVRNFIGQAFWAVGTMQHGWPRRTTDSRIHQESGGTGQA